MTDLILFNLAGRNEADVREGIIAPLLGKLGYVRGTSCDILTEITLTYPKIVMGRMKPTDPPLPRGRADYVLEVDRKLRWVVEAKHPDEPLTDEVIAQTFTYANHHSVRAIYFLVTNGREFAVSRTCDSPNQGPIVRLSGDELNQKFYILSNLLSPDSLRRDFPDFVLDAGEPIARGLRSFAKIENGRLTYEKVSTALPSDDLVGMQAFIKEGTVQRDESGRISAYMKFSSGRKQLDQVISKLGLEVFEISTDAKTVSEDRNIPTEFSSALDWTIPQGAEMFDPRSNHFIQLPVGLDVFTKTKAKVYLTGHVLSGSIIVDIMYTCMGINMPMHLEGDIEFIVG